MKKDAFELDYAVVSGSGTFPFDMLRHDRAFPSRETESSKLDWNPMNRTGFFRAVVVARYKGSPGSWTPERWRSFGWRFEKPAGYFQHEEATKLAKTREAESEKKD